MWNELADELGLLRVKRLTRFRGAQIAARLAEVGLDGWREALDRIRATPGLQGVNAKGFKPTFDWLCSEDGLARVLEGRYDGWGGKPGNGSGNGASPPAKDDPPWVLTDGRVIPEAAFDNWLNTVYRITEPLYGILSREEIRALDLAHKTEAELHALVAAYLGKTAP